jgi:protoporphyrinogen oxidase
LTAALVLVEGGSTVTVLEADPRYVGGISRTVEYKGFRFDIGGHRFFSKCQEVEDLWTRLLADDLLVRPRSSRIFYKRRFYSYPLRAFEALRNLGILESVLCVLSYAKARTFPVKNPICFEDWVSNQFGKRLFRTFFKTYTEKVWGMDCRSISADWAAQRIKGLSLASAIWNALLPSKPTSRKDTIKTLIDSFRYPRKGPGMMWDAAAARIRATGNEILLGSKVVGLKQVGNSWEVRVLGPDGEKTLQADSVISSMPLRELVWAVEPPLASRPAADQLKYRDFLTVALIAREKDIFDDNWIYIHDPSVKVGRIQNFKSWSPEMVPDPAFACYGLEYFCFEGDGLWNSPDSELIALAKREMASLGLVNEADIVDGCVVRQPKAYPVYDDNYARHVDTIKNELIAKCPGLAVVGRNGMHKYNNQDHAMMTGILAARNILEGHRNYDVWQVNQDAEYHETLSSSDQGASGLRLVPQTV